MTILFTLALALAGVRALPHVSKRQLDDQACVDSIPETPDPDTVNKVYLAGVAQNVSLIVMQATFETCMQETRCHNLACGDQDSVGAFQQRPSMGWGTPEECQDVTHSTNKFLEQAIPLAAANPGFTADQIAQGVQHAELGNLYAKHFDTANQLIAQAAAATGTAFPAAGGAAPPAPPPAGGGAAPPPPPPPPPAPPAGGACGAAPAPAPVPAPAGGGASGACKQYTVVAGDSCYKIAQANNVDVGVFISANPTLDKDCTNLMVGTAYCVPSA